MRAHSEVTKQEEEVLDLAVQVPESWLRAAANENCPQLGARLDALEALQCGLREALHTQGDGLDCGGLERRLRRAESKHTELLLRALYRDLGGGD